MRERGKYRRLAVNTLISIVLSLVLNFSYLVFMMVGTNREPAPKEPSKPLTEVVINNQTDAPQEAAARISPAATDSLKREVIIREENITRQRNNQRGSSSPFTTEVGKYFILIDILFYALITLLLLSIVTTSWREKHRNNFIHRLLMCLLVVIVAYFLSPQLTWRGEIIITANSNHLLNPMTLLKLTMALLVCVLYGKIYGLLYAKGAVEMENAKLKNENLTWQYNTLINQVNPHFLFNSLNSLSMLVREQNNANALTYISRMSDTYRYIIEEGKAESTTVENELRFLDAYRYLLEVRYAGKLHIEVTVGREYFGAEIPPLSIQPLIENAVKHNTITTARPLHIRIASEEGYIVVSNAIHPKLQPEESTGIGLENLSSRYELIVGRKIEVANDGKEFIVKLPIKR